MHHLVAAFMRSGVLSVRSARSRVRNALREVALRPARGPDTLPAMVRPKPSMFLTNHALVLIQIWREPDITVRVIAERVGITERATFRILTDLMERGCVERRRVGRNNAYLVRGNVHLRHPLVSSVEISELLKALGGAPGTGD